MSRVLIAMIVGLAGQIAHAVDVGDKAPPLDGVSVWHNGKAVNPGEGGQVHVVEFWATWCPPCRDSIPHLNALHEQYKDKGVVIAGISNEDPDVVEPFMKRMEMKYRVGVDSKRTTDRTYMKTVEGIPHAFIVNREGTVVWQGHPMDGLDHVLASVVDGTWDEAKARKMVEKQKIEQQLQGKLMEALQQEDLDGAIQALDKLAEVSSMGGQMKMFKAQLLMENGKAHQAAEVFREVYRESGEDPDTLNALAWAILELEPRHRDLGVALKAAKRAVELTDRENAAILDTLALAVYYLGDVAEAVAVQKEAIARSEDHAVAEDLRAKLTYYESVNALRATRSTSE